ncbi:MAG: hypothetical protein ACHQ49_11435 [Elusimicrobiota bacterium]
MTDPSLSRARGLLRAALAAAPAFLFAASSPGIAPRAAEAQAIDAAMAVPRSAPSAPLAPVDARSASALVPPTAFLAAPAASFGTPAPALSAAPLAAAEFSRIAPPAGAARNEAAHDRPVSIQDIESARDAGDAAFDGLASSAKPEIPDGRTPQRAESGLKVSVDPVPRTIQETYRRIKDIRKMGRAARVVEIARLAEFPHAYVAIFSQRGAMNMALDRATNFIESRDHRLLTPEERLRGGRGRTIAGHDLKGKDLILYRDAVVRSRRAGEDRRLTGSERRRLAAEDDFWEAFLAPALEREPDLVLVAVTSLKDSEENLSHELLHLAYFSSPKYRELVHGFWSREVSSADRAAMTRILGRTYDAGNRTTLENEFQAYLLQKAPTSYELGPFVRRYRRRLETLLEKSGR